MASRRDEKQSRREERMQGAEGKLRNATQTLASTARNAGYTPARIRAEILGGIRDVLGLGTFESRAVVVDTRTQRVVDSARVFQVVCDQERIDFLDDRRRQWWLSIVEDELERALKRGN